MNGQNQQDPYQAMIGAMSNATWSPVSEGSSMFSAPVLNTGDGYPINMYAAPDSQGVLRSMLELDDDSFFGQFSQSSLDPASKLRIAKDLITISRLLPVEKDGTAAKAQDALAKAASLMSGELKPSQIRDSLTQAFAFGDAYEKSSEAFDKLRELDVIPVQYLGKTKEQIEELRKLTGGGSDSQKPPVNYESWYGETFKSLARGAATGTAGMFRGLLESGLPNVNRSMLFERGKLTPDEATPLVGMGRAAATEFAPATDVGGVGKFLTQTTPEFAGSFAPYVAGGGLPTLAEGAASMGVSRMAQIGSRSAATGALQGLGSAAEQNLQAIGATDIEKFGNTLLQAGVGATAFVGPETGVFRRGATAGTALRRAQEVVTDATIETLQTAGEQAAEIATVAPQKEFEIEPLFDSFFGSLLISGSVETAKTALSQAVNAGGGNIGIPTAPVGAPGGGPSGGGPAQFVRPSDIGVTDAENEEVLSFVNSTGTRPDETISPTPPEDVDGGAFGYPADVGAKIAGAIDERQAEREYGDFTSMWRTLSGMVGRPFVTEEEFANAAGVTEEQAAKFLDDRAKEGVVSDVEMFSEPGRAASAVGRRILASEISEVPPKAATETKAEPATVTAGLVAPATKAQIGFVDAMRAMGVKLLFVGRSDGQQMQVPVYDESGEEIGSASQEAVTSKDGKTIIADANMDISRLIPVLAAHEPVHSLKSLAPEKYKELVSLLKTLLGKQFGKSVSDIQQKYGMMMAEWEAAKDALESRKSTLREAKTSGDKAAIKSAQEGVAAAEAEVKKAWDRSIKYDTRSKAFSALAEEEGAATTTELLGDMIVAARAKPEEFGRFMLQNYSTWEKIRGAITETLRAFGLTKREAMWVKDSRTLIDAGLAMDPTLDRAAASRVAIAFVETLKSISVTPETLASTAKAQAEAQAEAQAGAQAQAAPEAAQEGAAQAPARQAPEAQTPVQMAVEAGVRRPPPASERKMARMTEVLTPEGESAGVMDPAELSPLRRAPVAALQELLREESAFEESNTRRVLSSANFTDAQIRNFLRRRRDAREAATPEEVSIAGDIVDSIKSRLTPQQRARLDRTESGYNVDQIRAAIDAAKMDIEAQGMTPAARVALVRAEDRVKQAKEALKSSQEELAVVEGRSGRRSESARSAPLYPFTEAEIKQARVRVSETRQKLTQAEEAARTARTQPAQKANTAWMQVQSARRFSLGELQFRGKAIPESVMKSAGIDAAFELAESKKWGTQRDFKVAMQDRVIRAARAEGINITDIGQGDVLEAKSAKKEAEQNRKDIGSRLRSARDSGDAALVAELQAQYEQAKISVDEASNQLVLAERRAANKQRRVDSYLQKMMYAEAKAALAQDSSAVGWYDEKVRKAIAIMSLVYPELETDERMQFAFKWALAVTSNGMKVDRNFKLAVKAYDHYKSNGVFPTNIGEGTAKGGIDKGLGIFNDMVEQKGFDAFMRFATTKQSVSDIQKWSGINVSGELTSALVYGAAIVGPKIGNGFFANLYGHYEQLTMDRWFMRTFGRLTGTLIEERPDLAAYRRDRILKVFAEMSPQAMQEFFDASDVKMPKIRRSDDGAILISDDKLDELSQEFKSKLGIKDRREIVNKVSPMSVDQRNRLQRILSKVDESADDTLGQDERVSYTHGDALRKLFNGLAKDIDGQKEAPESGTERQRIRDIALPVLRELQKEYPDLTMADFQAVLWYPEKLLYEASKTEDQAAKKYHEESKPDYETAARALALEMGVGYNSIGQATQRITDEIDSAKRAGAVQRVAGGATGQPSDTEVAGPRYSLGEVRPAAGSGAGAFDGGATGAGSLAALAGAPQKQAVSGPDPKVHSAAERYARAAGIAFRRQSSYVEVDPDRARRLAEAYEAMPHAPDDPVVREAYENLIRQTRAQYDSLVEAGYRFWFTDTSIPSNLEYLASPWTALADLRNNMTMGVFPSTEGFGSGDFDASNNLLLVDTGLTWPSGGLDGPPKRVTANDLFRAVHDAFGHALEGAGFRARGEENAWQAHMRLYTGSARAAMTSETRGQNSWVNYGPHAQKNLTASSAETVFAEQKSGLMPSWTWTEGISPDQPPTTGGTIDAYGRSEEAPAVDQPRYSLGRPTARETLSDVASRREKQDGYQFSYSPRPDSRAGAESIGRGPVGKTTPEEWVSVAQTNKENHPYGASVDVYSPDKYSDFDLIIVRDGKGNSVTINVSPDGEAGGLTKSVNAPGSMVEAAFEAIMATGSVRWASAFETTLPARYAPLGLRAVARIPFPTDPKYIPKDWDYEKYKKYNNGRPDIVFMSATGEPHEYNPSSAPYVEDYDAGVAAAKSGPARRSLRLDLGRLRRISQYERQALREGEETEIGRTIPPLKLASTGKAGRAFERAVMEERKSQQETVPLSQMAAAAQAELEFDYDGVVDRIYDKWSKGDKSWSEWEQIATARIAQNKVQTYLRSGSRESLREASMWGWIYRDLGTKAGRVLAARRYTVPADGINEIEDAILEPSRYLKERMRSLQRRIDEELDQNRRMSLIVELESLHEYAARQAERAMNALRDAGIDPAVDANALNGDPVRTVQAAQIIADNKASGAEKAWDWFMTYRYASMLSGIPTHAANISGNFFNLVYEGPAKLALEAAANTVLKKEGSANFAELQSYMRSYMPALKQATHNFLLTLTTQVPALEAQLSSIGVDIGTGSEKIDLSDRRQTIQNNIFGLPVGRAVKFVGSFLMAQDQFFKTLAANTTAVSLAFRAAGGDSARMQSLLNDPESGIWDRAYEAASAATFTDRFRKDNGNIEAAMSIAEDTLYRVRDLGIGPVKPLQLIIPFVRTPMRVAYRGAAIPLHPLAMIARIPEYRKGAGNLPRDIGTLAMSTGIAMVVADMLSQYREDDDREKLPFITGSSPMEAPAAAAQRRTAPPMSIRINNEYYSYQRFDPASMAVGVTVDAVNKYMDISQKSGSGSEAAQEALVDAIASVARNLGDRTYMRTLGDIAKAYRDDTQRTSARMFDSVMVQPMIPAIARRAESAEEVYAPDYNIRPHQDESAWPSLWRKYSGEGPDLPKRDVWGRPIKANGRSWMARFASPAPVVGEVSDVQPADIVIMRYNELVDSGQISGKKFYPSLPEFTYTRNGETMYMTDDQYDRFLQMSGERALEVSNSIAENFKLEPSEKMIERMRDAITKARSSARRKIEAESFGQ